MLGVMLVDDEKTVRSGLRMMIPWDELGLKVIGESGDGDEGLEKLLTLSPDIVIADIRMPGMSGLDMLEEAKKRGFLGKAVILSGYSDFSYAQSAIALGVKKFILKPVDEDELIAELNRLSDEIKEERKTEFVKQKGSEYLQDELIKSLFLGTAGAEQITGIPQDGKFTVALISLSDNSDETDMVYDMLEGVENPIYVKLDLEHTLGLLFIGQGKTETTKFMEKITTEFAAVGKTVNSVFEIKESYRSATEIYRMKFLYMHTGVISPDILSKYWSESGEPEDITARLYAFVTVNDIEKLIDHLEKLHNIFMSGRFSPEAIRLIYINTVNEIVKASAKGGNDNKTSNLPTAEDIAKISSLPSLYEINNHVSELLCGISDNVFGDTTQSNIEKIVRYVAANFRTEIRLEGLAQLFGYNSAYLGKVFHKYTGENFNNYLDNIRITEAKRLLESGKYKVYEVAEMVGFSNINYFHNKFKKIVGISPMSYKKSGTE
ncbi:MAG: response regulator [Ruminococcus sp.]|jgi:two-component system response regulator YesN|nr:response regulator [Ruminococcus sp.]